jgi:hypothetical protein
MVYKNLVKGQYQIGDIVMGHGTNIIIEGFDVKPYDVNAQDYQITRSDEMRFGYDSFKPTTIEIQASVIYNYLLPAFTGTRTNFWHNMPTVSDLAMEWRANDIRNSWGEMKPLWFCGRDGIGKIIFGRPGQFGVEKADSKSTIVKCVAEFRRADTLVYSATENAVNLTHNAVPQYLWRGVGDASTWFRIVGVGPLTNPVITVGENQIELGVSFAAGEAFEISSYPWQRRAVKSDRTNLRNSLIGDTPYLDKMMIPVKQFVPIRWSSSNVNMWQPALGNASWGVDIEGRDYWSAPSGFQVINGKPIVRLDLFNPSGSTLFLGGQNFTSAIHACLYVGQWFNTTTQYMQARVTEPQDGRSAMIINSNSLMTNYALLEVVSGATNQLIIRTGSAYNTWSTARATYTKPSAWAETDVIGFGFSPTNNTYTAYLNGSVAATWADSMATPVVTVNATSNKYSGFIFNMAGGSVFSNGPGFKDITAYDNLLTASDTGSINLYWRDAWSTIE